MLVFVVDALNTVPIKVEYASVKARISVVSLCRFAMWSCTCFNGRCKELMYGSTGGSCKGDMTTTGLHSVQNSISISPLTSGSNDGNVRDTYPGISCVRKKSGSS